MGWELLGAPRALAHSTFAFNRVDPASRINQESISSRRASKISTALKRTRARSSGPVAAHARCALAAVR